jgi:hypothetical protein
MLVQVKLMSILSSRVTKKYGAGWRILFYNFYFPKEKNIDDNFVFINKGMAFNAPNMCS